MDWEKVDDDKVEAWIEVRVSPRKDEGFDAIARQITGYPEVRSVYLMSGAYDLMVRVEGNNLKNVAMFVAKHLSSLDGVISTATHFLLKSYKRDGVDVYKRQMLQNMYGQDFSTLKPLPQNLSQRIYLNLCGKKMLTKSCRCFL